MVDCYVELLATLVRNSQVSESELSTVKPKEGNWKRHLGSLCWKRQRKIEKKDISRSEVESALFKYLLKDSAIDTLKMITRFELSQRQQVDLIAELS